MLKEPIKDIESNLFEHLQKDGRKKMLETLGRL